MMTQPKLIEDTKLDETTGGIGMLLPAVQKVREAANRSSSTATLGTANGGVWKTTNGGL